MSRRLAYGLVSIILITASLASAIPAQAGGNRAGNSAGNSEGSVAWRVNHEHYSRRIHALDVSSSIAQKARQHSCDMARSQRLYHTADLRSQYSGWRILGENVAKGWDLYEIHRAWMESPAHRDNVLESRYKAIGAGVCQDGNGTYWVTTVFYG